MATITILGALVHTSIDVEWAQCRKHFLIEASQFFWRVLWLRDITIAFANGALLYCWPTEALRVYRLQRPRSHGMTTLAHLPRAMLVDDGTDTPSDIHPTQFAKKVINRHVPKRGRQCPRLWWLPMNM